MMAFLLGRTRGVITPEEYLHLIKELVDVPNKIKTILKTDKLIKGISEMYKSASSYNFV